MFRLPIVPLILALRLPLIQRILEKPLTKARKKSAEVLGEPPSPKILNFI